MIKEAIGKLSAMPNWQKGLTILGVATVGITITVLTTKGVKFGWGKLQDYKNKKELDKKANEASDAKFDTKAIKRQLFIDEKIKYMPYL